MASKGQLTDETRWGIIHHRKSGKDYKTIAAELGIALTTVKNTILYMEKVY